MPRKFTDSDRGRLNTHGVAKPNSLQRQAERMENVSLSDKAIQRLMEYLTDKGWTPSELLALIDYLTK